MWHLIVSIPDLCPLYYFTKRYNSIAIGPYLLLLYYECLNASMTFDEILIISAKRYRRTKMSQTDKLKERNMKSIIFHRKSLRGGCFPIIQRLPPSNEHMFFIIEVLTNIQACVFFYIFILMFYVYIKFCLKVRILLKFRHIDVYEYLNN